MKVAIIGYGKMGHEVEHTLLSRGHEIVFISDDLNSDYQHPVFCSAEVAVEFTQPDMAVANIQLCAEAGVPIVCGTTGWLHQLNEVTQFITEKQATLFYASNYSPGVFIFRQLNIQLARMMQQFPEYKPSLKETHHQYKKDAPSGTAITLAEELLANYPTLHAWNLGKAESNHHLSVESFRTGDVVGEHTITFTSAFDEITIQHEAFNRKGFALGAVLAAEFIHGKKGVYSMNNLFELK